MKYGIEEADCTEQSQLNPDDHGWPAENKK
jgi:hypothetical protein